MSFINIEIKARLVHWDSIRNYLLENNAQYKGADLQTDTYFNVPKGRLKLRQGNIENSLIYYERSDQAGPKQSNFNLIPLTPGADMLSLLTNSLGIKVQVKKIREIYFIKNVKFHIDEVPGLGNFVEIEASNLPEGYEAISIRELREQCEFYIEAFKIRQEDLLDQSYSDMLLSKK
jgi:adenylate cyclase, class 2